MENTFNSVNGLSLGETVLLIAIKKWDIKDKTYRYMENSWRNKFGHLKGNFGCKRWWQCWLNVGLEKTFHARYKFEIWDRNWLITSNIFFPRVRGEGLCNNVHCDKQIMRRYFYKYASRKPLRQLILRPTFPCRGRLYTELYCLQVLFFGNIRSHPALIGT